MRPGRVAGQVGGGLQADADLEKVGDDRVEEFLAAMHPPGGSSGGVNVGEAADRGHVPHHGQGEPAGGGLHGAEADLHREGRPVFVQPGQQGAGAHRPGPGGLQVGGNQALQRLAGQFGGRVAEHLLQAPASQHERAFAVGQRHPVAERLDHVPQHARGHDRGGPRAALGQRQSNVGRSRRGAGHPPSPTAPSGARVRHRERGVHDRRPRGQGCLHGRVDGHQAADAGHAQHPQDDPAGDDQPQLDAAGHGALVSPRHRIGARVIARERGRHVRDQCLSAAVDNRQ